MFTEVGWQGSFKRAEKKRAEEQQREGDEQRKGRDESKRVRSGVICRAERKCAATVMVWMFAWESREWWEIKRGDRQIQHALQHNGQLLLFLLTDKLERGSTVNPSPRLQNSLTNSWNCNCANFCINAGNMDQKPVTARLTWKPKAGRSTLFVGSAANQNRCVPGWYSLRKKNRSETHACTYTQQELRIAAKWSKLWLHPTAV